MFIFDEDFQKLRFPVRVELFKVTFEDHGTVVLELEAGPGGDPPMSNLVGAVQAVFGQGDIVVEWMSPDREPL